MTRFRILTALSVLFLCPWFEASLLPHNSLDCVVAIGRMEIDPVTKKNQWVAEVSGFIYGDFVSKANDKENVYELFLVTNRHVVEGHAAITKAPLSVKFNLKPPGSAREYDIPMVDPQGHPTWYFHPNPAIDVAVLRLNGGFLNAEGARFEFFHSESNVLRRSKAAELGLSEGAGVFILGFPMGLVGQQQDYVIVRQGTLARVTDSLQDPASTSFLVDSFVFPGNSGGPVILRPELISITGEKPPINQAYLLGMVRDYIPYTDMAVSMQTKRPRITFEENSGLSDVIPIDYVEEAIKDYEKLNPIPAPAPAPAVSIPAH